uniref:Uncharacterized protein n=1 Tax=Grammatophora oceanica TaxID=210454 RepID=A0A7S1YHW5_9STRA|mmetsp:Transcript_47503/g.70705  ORF Transcript_47503/g.70705 Transcript_47503/m.70705 type:complete len:869 (+) Transcript_47503:353-2959(+)
MSSSGVGADEMNEPKHEQSTAGETQQQQQQQPYRETIDGVLGGNGDSVSDTQQQSSTSVRPTATAQLQYDSSAMRADVADRLTASVGNAVTTKNASFAALKQNWETIINQGTRGLQNLSLCGAGADGIAQIAAGAAVPGTSGGTGEDAPTDDPFAPIVLRHTHSLPLVYSHSLMDDDEPILPPVGLDSTRRSSSTPSSSSAFRSRSATSAFGPKLRTMPHLGGPDDRSAFTLPMQRSSYASSDSGIRYSSPFDPFFDDVERTSIEVTNMGAPSRTGADKKEEGSTEGGAAHKESAASKARRFMSNNFRVMRRKRRSGRENPARPPSTSSSSKSSEDSRQNQADDESLSTKSSAGGREASTKPKSTGLTVKQAFSGTNPQKSSRKGSSKKDNTSLGKKSSYHQLGSDVDEDDQQQRLSLDVESPTAIPSPAYHHFPDDRPNSRTESTDVVGHEDDANVVKIEVSSSAKPSSTPLVELSPNRDFIGCADESSPSTGSFSPTPTVRSSVTQSTSGIGSFTSSGGRTQLSTVSETDREVMETNKAGKLARKLSQHNRKKNNNAEGGEHVSVHSASTSSTNTHGYLVLGNSPVPPREGATMPVDRFFSNSRIATTHSPSSSNSSTSVRSTSVIKGDGSFDVSQSSSDPSKKTDASPISLKSSMSSQSTTEEPPQFVSYHMDHQTTGQSKGISTVSSQRTPDSSDRDSPARIVPVGYSEVIFEEAKPQASTLIRPGVKCRAKRVTSRPPLSPAKGLRTPTTPPPSSSPAHYQQLSPPNIVDQVDRTGDLSKPYVFRSGPGRGPVRDGKKHLVLVAPDSASFTVTSTLDVIPDDESMASSYYNTEDLTRSRTYQENSLPLARPADPAVVTPERGI